MTWEQHRFAVERARDRLKKEADAAESARGGISIQSVAGHTDAEMLDEVAEFLLTLDGPKNGFPTRENFVMQWNKTIAQVGVFAQQQKLPAPELIFNPLWHDKINDACDSPILGTLIWMGVRIRFGAFEQRDVLRQY